MNVSVKANFNHDLSLRNTLYLVRVIHSDWISFVEGEGDVFLSFNL
jgi:hypothetical protein